MPDFKYPTLRPSHSIRMAKHQTGQGFAPSSEHSAVYFQTVRQASQPVIRMPDADEALAEATRQALRLSTASPASVPPSRRLTAHDVEREAREFIGKAQQHRATCKSCSWPSSAVLTHLLTCSQHSPRAAKSCALYTFLLHSSVALSRW